jgi:ribosomal-protein-alanine N-acetyltransferase
MNEEIFAIFPVMNLGNGVILRKISVENDYVDFFNYINHPKVSDYLGSTDIPESLENAKIELAYWDRMFDYKSSIYWAIALEASNKIIGTAGYNYWNKEQRRAEISYDLDFNYWNKGITTSAIKAIINFGLHDMQIQRIKETVAIDNISSKKVLEKNGFKQEGLMKKYGILKGKTKDFYMYAISL